MTQRVEGFIGCPGSGKSTLSLKYNPHEWVVLTLDDWRQALWPPHRRTYWDVRAGGKDKQAQFLLHHVQRSALSGALATGWNVLLADTHINKPAFEMELKIIRDFDCVVHWKLLEVPYDVLVERNKNRSQELGHKVPEEILRNMHIKMWAPDAWWRNEPNVETIPYGG